MNDLIGELSRKDVTARHPVTRSTTSVPAPNAGEHCSALSTPCWPPTSCALRRLSRRGSSWACRARALRLLPWLGVGGPALAQLVWRCGLDPVLLSVGPSVGGALVAVALLWLHDRRAARVAFGPRREQVGTALSRRPVVGVKPARCDTSVTTAPVAAGQGLGIGLVIRQQVAP